MRNETEETSTVSDSGESVKIEGLCLGCSAFVSLLFADPMELGRNVELLCDKCREKRSRMEKLVDHCLSAPEIVPIGDIVPVGDIEEISR
jgi:hypothetical protein